MIADHHRRNGARSRPRPDAATSLAGPEKPNEPKSRKNPGLWAFQADFADGNAALPQEPNEPEKPR